MNVACGDTLSGPHNDPQLDSTKLDHINSNIVQFHR